MLTNGDQRRLYDSGFTIYEIRLFHNALTPSGQRQPIANIDSSGWQRMIEDRERRVSRIRQKWQDIKGKPMTRLEQSTQINRWYVKHKTADPFDWLKREYGVNLGVTRRKVRKSTRRLQSFPGARKYTRKQLPSQFD